MYSASRCPRSVYTHRSSPCHWKSCIPLPFLSFLLLFLFPPTLSSSLQYHSSFTSYIPTVIVSSSLTPLFTHGLTSVSFLFSIMHSGQVPPARDDRVMFLIPRYYCSPTSASSFILASPESRKILYFLLLNVLFALLQMLYGVWTHSLGLISDVIHMAFDCMEIAMGLFEIVMSGWERIERLTCGY